MASGNQTWNSAQENITKAQHRVEEFMKTGADHDATVAGNRVAETRQHIENKAKEGQQAGTTFIEKIVGNTGATGHTDTTAHSTAATDTTASTGPTTAEKVKQAANTVIDKVFGTTGNTATTTDTTHSSV